MHLGARVSALLDGRLPAAEEERAWSHVHECPPCRDLVEREGWIKTRLACLSVADRADRAASARLKDSLLAPSSLAPSSLAPGSLSVNQSSPLAASPFATALTGARRRTSLVAIGGGAAGVAVVGVLALGGTVAPQLDPRVPVSDLSRPTPSLSPVVLKPVSDAASGPRTVRGPGHQTDHVVTAVSEMAARVEVVRQAPRVTMAP